MADTSTKKVITVSGHLEDVHGIFHAKLTWTDETGKRGRKSVSTGLVAKGNRKRAEDMLYEIKKEREAALKNMPRLDNMLFADFIERNWLEAVRRGDRNAVKRKVKLTTFGGYQTNVQRVVAPYFRKERILLTEITIRTKTRNTILVLVKCTLQTSGLRHIMKKSRPDALSFSVTL